MAPALPPWAAPLAKTSRARNWYFTLANSTVAAANATGTTLDVAFYGDSLTGLLVTIPANVAVWREFFGEEATGWKAGLMGVAGARPQQGFQFGVEGGTPPRARCGSPQRGTFRRAHARCTWPPHPLHRSQAAPWRSWCGGCW